MSRVDTSDPAIAEALADVRNDDTPTNWMLLGYVPRNNNKLRLMGTGEDGWEEMCEDISDGKVQFGLCRFKVKSIYRYAFLAWCGEGVIGIQKGQFSNHSRDMEQFFRGFHVQLNARYEEDLEEDIVIKKLTTSLGAAYEAGGIKQGTGSAPKNVKEAQRSVTQTKEYVKEDKPLIDQNQSESYWANNSATENVGSGYKKAEVNSSDAGSLKSKYEQMAQAPPPSKPAPTYDDSNEEGYIEFDDTPQEEASYEEAAPEESYEEEAPEEAYEEEAYEEEAYEEEAYEEEAYEEEAYEEEAYEEEAYEEEYEEEEYEEEYEEASLQATALYDYAGEQEGDLSFKAGDIIEVYTQEESGWWTGCVNGRTGAFPSNFVEQC